MNFKKLGLTLVLSAAFGLVACGDDSSTNASDSKKADSTKKYEEAQEELLNFEKEAFEAMEKLGKCSSKNEGEKKTFKAAGKSFTAVCDGEDWDSEDAADYFEELTKKIEDASGDLIKEEIKASGCKFKESDDTWSFEYSTKDGGSTFNNSVVIKIKGSKYTMTSKDVSSGSEISLACKYIESGKEETDNGYIETSCSGGKMTITEYEEDSFRDRTEFFNEIMSDCQLVNGNPNWEPEESKKDAKKDSEKEDLKNEDGDDEDINDTKDSEKEDNVDKPSKDEKDDSEDDDSDIDETIKALEDLGMDEEEIEAYKELLEQIEKAEKAEEERGECTDEREGEKSEMEYYGTKMFYVCKDGEWDIDYEAYGYDPSMLDEMDTEEEE